MKLAMDMQELNLEADFTEDSDEDCDVCDSDEINRIFPKCLCTAEKATNEKNNFILNIAATVEKNPNVAVGLSEVCKVYSLGDTDFAKVASFEEHLEIIVDLKFCPDNNSLLYTGSADGTVRLWDLRVPEKSQVQFKDTTVENDAKHKPISCFDVSPNNRLLAAGTNLCDGDPFILFWDIRKSSLMGAYWESHTDDITQVKFAPEDSNKLISGSVDGLISSYDLTQESEDDALVECLNTESSVEKLSWFEHKGNDVISCITHTADVQLWRLDDAQPYLSANRTKISKGMRKKSEDYIYVVDVLATSSDVLLLAGSNFQEGECLRGLKLGKGTPQPFAGFPENKQRVRCCWFNSNTNLLLSGGEKGIINAWDVKKRK